MSYVGRDGFVLERQPWDMARILAIFTGLWFMLMQFFNTLLAPFRQDNKSGNTSRRNGGWGSGGGDGGGGGGGGGSGGGGGNGGPRTNRRIGRVVNSMDCNIPGGGCCG